MNGNKILSGLLVVIMICQGIVYATDVTVSDEDNSAFETPVDENEDAVDLFDVADDSTVTISSAYIYGDADDDGDVDDDDVEYMRQIVLGEITADERTIGACDFNENGEIDIGDVIILRTALANDALYSLYPVLASGTCGDDVTWTLYEEGTLEISGTGDMEDYISYLSVPWYSNRSGIVSVVLGDEVTSIGDYVFYYCSSLANLTIPDSIINIGNSAFQYCSALTDVTIGNGVTNIGSNAFRYCSNLTNVTIPDGVTSIGSYAFSKCGNLTSVTIPDSVTSIGNFAFLNCGNLIITVGENNAYYSSEDGVLFNKDKSTLVTYAKDNVVSEYEMPDSVITIDSYAFSNCTNLIKVTIPNSVITISERAFWGCTGLTNVTIGNGLTSIGNYAFCNCSDLTRVTIPDSVTTIGEWTFQYCTNLTSVIIGNSVTSIDIGVFYSCTSLTNVVIPDSVTTISERAFFECTSLTSVTIGNGVTNIGSGAFRYCSGLESVTIPDSVTNIGSYAFNNCSGLVSVTIPDSVTSIGSLAFMNCGDLIITVDENNPRYSSEDGVLFKEKTTLVAYAKDNIVSEYTIPDSVTSIGSSAFFECTGLTGVTIASGVTSINSRAFFGCTSLTSVTIPNSVTSISSQAFSNCSGLKRVTIGSGVTSIGVSAFSDCSDITDVYYIGTEDEWNAITIGNDNDSLTYAEMHYSETNTVDSGTCGDSTTWLYANGTLTISGTGAMTDFDSYVDVPWYELRNSIKSVIVEDGVTNVGSYSFCSSQKLSSVTLGENLTSIGVYAFSLCSNIIEITIPDTVMTIDESAFYGCTALTKLVLSKQIKNINENAFYGCSNLSDVYYDGNLSGWNAINILSGNDSLYTAAIILSTDTNALPTISSKNVLGGVEVTLESEYENIYYTTTGSSPSTSSTLYESAFKLTKAGTYTIKAMSSNGVSNSDTAELTITVGQTEVPSLSYSNGYVTIESNATVYYAFGLSTPDSKDYIYSSPIEITESTYISARAAEYGCAKSEVVSLYCECQSESKEYDPLIDSYGFENTKKQLYGFSNIKPYSISEETYQEVFGNTIGHSLYETWNSSWNGSCFGLSLTAELFFMNYINQDSYENGADCVYDIPAPQSPDKAITKLIENCHIVQFLENLQTEQHNNYVKSGEDDIMNIVSALQDCEENPIILYIERLNNDEIFAHAVLPYAIESNSNGTYSIFVYDPNLPASSDDYERILTIDTTDNTFLYVGQYTYDYAISYMSISTLMDNIDSVSLFASEENDKILFTANSADVSIYNSVGTEVNNIDGAVKYRSTDSSLADSVTWLLPADNYTVNNQNNELEGLEVSVANEDDYYSMTVSDTSGTVIFGYASDKLYINYLAASNTQITVNSYNSEKKTSVSSVVSDYIYVTSLNSNSVVLSTNASTITSNGSSVASIASNKMTSDTGNYVMTVSQDIANEVNHDCSITIVSSPQFTDNKITGAFKFYLENKGEVEENGNVYIATYDEDTGKLISIKSETNVSVEADDSCVISADLNITGLVTGHQYLTKIFFWDKNQAPNCDNAEIYY